MTSKNMSSDKKMHVVIVGGGTAGWMSAGILARLMGNQINITLVESDKVGTIGVGEATIPPIIQFNKALGIDENEFLKSTGGTFKLGIEFESWNEPEQSYMHAFGRIGKDMGFAPFHHTWLRAKERGDKRSFWDFSINYQAAKNNKYQPMNKIPHTELPGIAYAYHFDAGLYAKFLRQKCESWGVKRIEGFIADVVLNPEDGFISSVKLDDGSNISGDFFIDCSGFRALLIGEALKTGYEDWRHWLPCDRAIAMPCSRTEPLLPYTRSIAHEAGWMWRIPLQHRTGNGIVYCSDFLDDERAEKILRDNLDGQALAEPNKIKFVTGRRSKQWYKNCLSLGLASGFLEPLESTSLHLVQSGITRFIKFFPKYGVSPVDVDEYNRQSKIEFEKIRDFLILHYVLNSRKESFWNGCRNMDIPESLTNKIDLFSANGRVFRDQDELFTEIAWHQVMIGQGLIPNNYHGLVDSLSEQQLNELLDTLEGIITGTVEKLSDHSAYIKQSAPTNQEIH